jgi:hypothetical protein
VAHPPYHVGTADTVYTGTDSSSASEPTANCVGVCVGAITAAHSSQPNRSYERSGCCCRPGNSHPFKVGFSFRITSPIDALLGNDRTTSRTRYRICWHAFLRGHMYNNRIGSFRNSKPRNAKPSPTVVRRLFSWFTTNRRAANWFWRRSHACRACGSVRASSTISSA